MGRRGDEFFLSFSFFLELAGGAEKWPKAVAGCLVNVVWVHLARKIFLTIFKEIVLNKYLFNYFS